MNQATRASSAKRRWTAWAIAVAVVSTLPLHAAAEDTATADAIGRAEAYAAEAFAAYNDKNYDDAIVLYLKSLEASPSATALYNLAHIYDTKVGDRALAMTYYRRYVADSGAEPERVRVVNERLRALRELDAAATETPAPNRSSQNRPAPPVTEKERKLSGLQIAGLVTGVTGLAGLGLGTGFGLAAKSDADVAKDACSGNDCTTQRGVNAAHDASDAARIATISFIAGGALTVVGGALFVWGRQKSARSDSRSAYFAPAVGAGSLGGQFTGKW